MQLLRTFFRSPVPIPEQHRRNFFHLYMDVFWFGLLNGSTIVFLSIYATRCGATPVEIGFLTAAPALINMLVTLPAGIWLKRFSPHKATCWAWAATRVFYLLLIPLPFLLPPTSQVWAILLITLLMNIPGTLAAIIGNSFFAATVPPEFRGQVVGTRNALLAAATMITSLISGQILTRMPFPSGYVVVFSLGFLGAVLSNLHLFLIHPLEDKAEYGQAGELPSVSVKDSLRLDILSGPFGRILLLLVLYNLGATLGAPVFPLYQVRVLNFNDQTISLGTSIFYVVYFIASTRCSSLGRRIGNQKMTALGVGLTSGSVALFIVSYHPILYVLNNVVGGLAWAMVGAGVMNYLLERVPAGQRTSYLAWYNMAANAAALSGSMLGSQLASSIGLLGTMILVAIARLLAGVSILRWGNPPGSATEQAAPDVEG